MFKPVLVIADDDDRRAGAQHRHAGVQHTQAAADDRHAAAHAGIHRFGGMDTAGDRFDERAGLRRSCYRAGCAPVSLPHWTIFGEGAIGVDAQLGELVAHQVVVAAVQ